MLGLTFLPYEVLLNIVLNIDFDDVFNLAIVSKYMTFLINDNSLAKKIVQSKIPYSHEVKEAKSDQSYSVALRRAIKRRHAIATVSPYTVATIGFCDAYLYYKGILCYILDETMRISDLHNSSDREIVVKLPRLLSAALPIGSNTKGNIQVLYSSDGIITLLYSSSSSLPLTAWLLAFCWRRKAIMLVKELDSTEKLFARHNENFLYYGTYSETSPSGNTAWVIHGWDFRERKWFGKRIHLSKMEEFEIGSSVCFEFHGDYFYALSIQDLDEVKWRSFYYCIRFPLNNEGSVETQYLWRRDHKEGPIDTRWESLQLNVDETSGELQIIESRKEWHPPSFSHTRRSFYTTKIIFSKLEDDSEGDSLSEVSNSQVTTSLQALRRIPHNTHLGDDGSTLANTRLHVYHPFCSTCLDLVNDQRKGMQHLRLRGGSRRLGPPPRDALGLLRPHSDDLHVATGELYVDEGVKYWPPAQDLNPIHIDVETDELHKLLNPPTHLDNVMGTADERSLVYVTGDKPQALIFVGFDAGVRLRGLESWDCVEKRGRGVAVNEIGGAAALDSKGKEREIEHEGTPFNHTTDSGWAQSEPAMYLDINRGYNFGLERSILQN